MLLLTPAIASINARNPYHLDDNAKVLYGAGHFVAVGRRWSPILCALTFFSVRIPTLYLRLTKKLHNQPNLLRRIRMAVDVPMGVRQRLHQFRTPFDVMAQVFQCRLDVLRLGPVESCQLTFAISAFFYHAFSFFWHFVLYR